MLPIHVVRALTTCSSLRTTPTTLQILEFEMSSDEGDDATLDPFSEVERLHAYGKFNEVRALFEKISSPAECEPDTVTVGPTGVVNWRRGETVLRVINGGAEPLPSGAIKKQIF
jgi:hypothetical protein